MDLLNTDTLSFNITQYKLLYVCMYVLYIIYIAKYIYIYMVHPHKPNVLRASMLQKETDLMERMI